jgi:hypothetical protein
MSRAASAAAAALLVGTLGTHGCEMAPREPVPEKKKPAKEEKATPAVEPYTAEQTRDIQQQCQNRAEGQALQAMADKRLKRETPIQVYVEIDADGLIQKARCDFSPADHPDFGLDVQHLFLQSKILRVPRAGSCTMTFQLKPKAPDDRGTHMFERAPAPREPR